MHLKRDSPSTESTAAREYSRDLKESLLSLSSHLGGGVLTSHNAPFFAISKGGKRSIMLMGANILKNLKKKATSYSVYLVSDVF